MQKITVEAIMSFKPCERYTFQVLRDIVGDGLTRTGAEAAAMRFSRQDTRWIIAHLLSREQRVNWAQACAARAQGYVEKTTGTWSIFADKAREWAAQTAIAASESSDARSIRCAQLAATQSDEGDVCGDDEHGKAIRHGLNLIFS